MSEKALAQRVVGGQNRVRVERGEDARLDVRGSLGSWARISYVLPRITVLQRL